MFNNILEFIVTHTDLRLACTIFVGVLAAKFVALAFNVTVALLAEIISWIQELFMNTPFGHHKQRGISIYESGKKAVHSNM